MTAIVDQDHYLFHLEQLKKGSRVVLWGAGHLGELLQKRIREERPDIEIRAFIDSFKEGDLDGTPIYDWQSFRASPLSCDLLLIATIHWVSEVVRQIEPEGIPYQISLVSEVKEALRFTEEEWENYSFKRAEVEEMLQREEDKKLWREIMGAMKSGETASLGKSFATAPGLPYLDCLSLKKGEFVLEGGVYDGLHTLQFANRVGPEGKVFGFEPYPSKELFLNFGQRDNIRIVSKALWNAEVPLYLTPSGAESFVSTREKKDSLATEGLSVDCFVKEEKLKRVDYFKLDIEGAEPEAIEGAMETIFRFRPNLALSIYHEKEHFFSIPLFLKERLENYRYFLRNYTPTVGDTVFYALPEERL